VQGNAAQGREGSFVEGNGRGFWKFRDEQTWHTSYFGVDCVTGARTCHPIAYPNVCYPFPNAYDAACAAIPQRQRLVQTAAERLHSREQSVAANLAKHFPNQVWARPGLLKQVLAGKF
jgi:hypothetical protein